ncbi:hypothetical protein TURU_112642 [Turdus rufiventris]|nr:hypothetical protein TURU_112642 [Turdus rufiventris]
MRAMAVAPGLATMLSPALPGGLLILSQLFDRGRICNPFPLLSDDGNAHENVPGWKGSIRIMSPTHIPAQDSSEKPIMA